MMDDKKNALRSVVGSSGDIFINLGLAFAFSFGLKQLGIGGQEGSLGSHIEFAIITAVIFSDPAKQWRKREGWGRFCLKFILAGAFGLGVAASIFSDSLAFSSSGEGLPWYLLGIFLITPFAFLLPTVVRSLTSKQSSADRIEEVQIAAAFPIYVTWMMVLHLGIPVALWLVGAGIPFALALYMASIVLCVMEVAYAPAEASERDLSEEWGPRPDSSRESWANLRKALEQSFASGLFIGSIMFVTIKLVWPILDDMEFETTNPMGVIWPVLQSGVVSIVVLLEMIGAGSLIVSVVAFGFARLRGSDMLDIVSLTERSSGRLLMGGLSWVRPELDKD